MILNLYTLAEPLDPLFVFFFSQEMKYALGTPPMIDEPEKHRQMVGMHGE